MHIVVHYSEIGTKGKNREFFERILMRNIRSLCGRNLSSVQRRYGRIVCRLREGASPEETLRTLSRIPGVSSVMPSLKSPLDPERIAETSLKAVSSRSFETFAVKTTRSSKEFPKTSQEMNILIGSRIAGTLGKKVNLKNPDLTVYVEIGEREAFIGTEKEKGPGGLPVGSSGTVVSSLSGGIDSPVASWMMMKRGCEVVFAHIHNPSASGNPEKIRKIAKQLSLYQGHSLLYIVPFGNLQREIIAKVPSKLRMIIYRRFMMRILNLIAERENAKAIVTGDSVGQVASQTLENIACIREASKLPVLSPLIGMNKEEITSLAKDIGTYELSVIPYPDCCSFLVAKHPETKASIEIARKAEAGIEEPERLVRECAEQADIITFT